MVWYNPSSWFAPATEESVFEPTPSADYSAQPQSFGYGGRKRKTVRKGKKVTKRKRTGKRATRS